MPPRSQPEPWLARGGWRGLRGASSTAAASCTLAPSPGRCVPPLLGLSRQGLISRTRPASPAGPAIPPTQYMPVSLPCPPAPAIPRPAGMCSRLSGETRYRVPTPTRPSPTPTSITLRCSCKGRTSGVRLSACQRGEQAESHQSRVSNSP